VAAKKAISKLAISSNLGRLRDYRLTGEQEVRTPALAIYADTVSRNIDTTLRLLGQRAARWRPHLKTAKLAATLRLLRERGVMQAKCATVLELRTACEAGFEDVLVAYPLMGAKVAELAQVASEFPRTRVSTLVESRVQLESWIGRGVGLFLDINSGMNRTGIDHADSDAIIKLARAIVSQGIEFRGLHWYDGHIGALRGRAAERLAHRGYRQLIALAERIEEAGVRIEEIITSGTPAFPWALSSTALRNWQGQHRVSPGTLIYNDATSLDQLPAAFDYKPAVAVLTTVVSHPANGLITCDAGHKTVSADAGVPTCVVVGYEGLSPMKPSEEHLPVAVTEKNRVLRGQVLYLVPRHVCPTVNNFDYALWVRGQKIICVEKVTARGRTAPLEQAVRAGASFASASAAAGR
jgi:D-serine deaminase-like pyridoxal phosphate-dependent protein